jgi:hypothetical protein
VVATKESERKILNDLLERGKTNGVQRLRVIEKKELFEMEPLLNPNVIAALYSPDAGNVIPYVSKTENALAIYLGKSPTNRKLRSSFPLCCLILGVHHCFGRKCRRQWCRIADPSTSHFHYSD